MGGNKETFSWNVCSKKLGFQSLAYFVLFLKIIIGVKMIKFPIGNLVNTFFMQLFFHIEYNFYYINITYIFDNL